MILKYPPMWAGIHAKKEQAFAYLTNTFKVRQFDTLTTENTTMEDRHVAL